MTSVGLADRVSGYCPRMSDLIDRIENAHRLDSVSARLQNALEPIVGRGSVRDALTGRWLGHPAHPAVVVAPLAGWLGGTLLAVTGSPGSARASQRLIGAGTIAALPAALSGAADWLTTRGAEERVGTIHATLANGATAAFVSSWILRARRHDRAAIAAAVLGAGLAGATAFLGGHLSFRRGVGVSTVAFHAGPQEWTPIELDGEPSVDRPVRGVAEHTAFAVVATAAAGRELHVLEARCSHRGGPLDEGAVVDGCLQCPWHGARFDLASGAVRRGPAACPQPTYEVRTTGDIVSIRRSEPGGLRSDTVSAT